MKTLTKKEKQHVDIPSLTPEALRQFPGLSGLSDQEAQNILESLLLFSQLTYSLLTKHQ